MAKNKKGKKSKRSSKQNGLQSFGVFQAGAPQSVSCTKNTNQVVDMTCCANKMTDVERAAEEFAQKIKDFFLDFFYRDRERMRRLWFSPQELEKITCGEPSSLEKMCLRDRRAEKLANAKMGFRPIRTPSNADAALDKIIVNEPVAEYMKKIEEPVSEFMKKFEKDGIIAIDCDGPEEKDPVKDIVAEKRNAMTPQERAEVDNVLKGLRIDWQQIADAMIAAGLNKKSKKARKKMKSTNKKTSKAPAKKTSTKAPKAPARKPATKKK